MRTATLLKILQLHAGRPIAVKVKNEIFGNYEIIFGAMHTELMVDGDLVIIDRTTHEERFVPDDIYDIEALTTEADIVNMVEAAHTLNDAYQVAKHMLTPRVENALERARIRLRPSPEQQERNLAALIRTKMGVGTHTSVIARVLEHLCVNTLGTRNIATTASDDEYMRMAQGIDEAVKKVTDIPF